MGISADSVHAHTKFMAKCGLSFPLLSDTTKSVATAYGAWGEKKVRGRTMIGMRRMTFLIDEEGTIQQMWSTVKPEGHAVEVLAAIQRG